MPVPLFTVDAFTSKPFAGNPAAVCILPAPSTAAWMQAIAAEMNLSETAFLVPRPTETFDLRWFTPAVEVDLCGHATLASAHVLWETGRLASGEIARFHTKSGLLTATRAGNRIEMDFPAKPVAEANAPDDLLPSLGGNAKSVRRNRMDYLVELSSETDVRALSPDYARLARVECRGVIATAQADPGTGVDFVSRFFAPASGIDEDPVTGSAHCALGPFWRERLNKVELVGRQLSKRGGMVAVQCAGDRVVLGGHAVTILKAELLA